MRRREVLDRIVDFQRRYDVRGYKVAGFCLWPIIRTAAAFRLLGLEGKGQAGNQAGEKGFRAKRSQGTGGFWRGAAKALGRSKARLEESLGIRPPPAPPVDAVILTYASRLIPWDDGRYHTILDPLAGFLREEGVSFAAWEWGEGEGKRPTVPVRLDRRAGLESSRQARRLPRAWAAPEWYGSVEEWMAGMGAALPWVELSGQARQVLVLSWIMERWIRRSGCRLLLVDSWYDIPSMAACLAAARAGIPRVDLQHGLQDQAHYAYAGWAGGSYEVRPDLFWIWGEESGAASSDVAGPPDRVLVGGNLWMNRWKVSADGAIEPFLARAEEIARGHDRSVLVTLQPGVRILDTIADAMQKSPPTWQWLVRLHRQMAGESEAVAARLGGRAVVKEATALPLYALLKAADAHVTAFSTCALEALAFGVPTVVIHRDGEEAYGGFLRDGVMLKAVDGASLARSLAEAFHLERSACLAAGEKIFASADASRAAIRRLKEIAEIGGKG